MANPDIAAALSQLETHLIAADAALTNPCLDVARGFPTGAGQLRYYFAGEVAPPKFSGRRVLNGELVGQRFAIIRTWAASDLSPATVASIDVEMQALAGQIRTRLQADNDLGDHIDNLDLGYAEPDVLSISGIRCIVVRWELDMAYVEYAVSK